MTFLTLNEKSYYIQILLADVFKQDLISPRWSSRNTQNYLDE